MEPLFIKPNNLASLASNFTAYKARTRIEPDKDRMITDLKARNQCLKQFTYIISHNLKAPLRNLKGLIDLLNYDILDDYNKAIVKLFSDSMLHLDDTINELSQMISIHNNHNPAKETVSISKTFQKVCLDFTKQIHTMGIIIHTDFETDKIPFIKSYLESIFNNLLSNAIKYASPERRLKLSIASRYTSEEQVTITFTDNGLGIDLERYKDRIFGLNQRFHSHVEGNGLGLYMTKTQVESLKGHIEIESTVNKGSTFKINVPGDIHL